MVVRIIKNLVFNKYSANIATEFDSHELVYMAAYGEPAVQVGGDISYDGGGTLHKKPSELFMRSQFPTSFELDITTDDAARSKVDGWAVAVRSNLQAALYALMAKSAPNFPNTTVYQLIYVD